ncbi:hypothetical protein D3C76_994480 [compost metagenome]
MEILQDSHLVLFLILAMVFQMLDIDNLNHYLLLQKQIQIFPKELHSILNISFDYI